MVWPLSPTSPVSAMSADDASASCMHWASAAEKQLSQMHGASRAVCLMWARKQRCVQACLRDVCVPSTARADVVESENVLYMFAPSGTHPEARMGHLTIYGATYYSYTYARCLSSAIWNKLLAHDPLDPGAGG